MTTYTVQLPVRDETGQRHDVVRVREDSIWDEVTALAVDCLDLPIWIAPQEPAVYHSYNDETGEALNPSASVAETIEQTGTIFTVLVAPEMNPAGAVHA